MSAGGPSAVAAGLLTVAAAARQAGVPRGIVEGWITNGHLPAVLVDHRRRVRTEELAAVQARALVGVVLAWRRDRQRVGMRLQALREAAGMNQRELAATSGVSHRTIMRIEAGRFAPYAETVRRLACALQIEPERFFTRDPVGQTMLSLPEAAAQLGVPVSRVRRWLQQGTLAGTKVSGKWRVVVAGVEEFARSG